jgi:hypothetical protein
MSELHYSEVDSIQTSLNCFLPSSSVHSNESQSRFADFKAETFTPFPYKTQHCLEIILSKTFFLLEKFSPDHEMYFE